MLVRSLPLKLISISVMITNKNGIKGYTDERIQIRERGGGKYTYLYVIVKEFFWGEAGVSKPSNFCTSHVFF